MMLIVPLTSEIMTDALSYATELIGDLMPYILVVIGISIGAMVLNIVLHKKDD